MKFALRRISGIYQLTHTVTGDVYVGSSRNIMVRLGQHISDLERGTSVCCRLQTLANAHGVTFTAEILEEIHEVFLTQAERKWVQKLAPTMNTNLHCTGVTTEKMNTPKRK